MDSVRNPRLKLEVLTWLNEAHPHLDIVRIWPEKESADFLHRSGAWWWVVHRLQYPSLKPEAWDAPGVLDLLPASKALFEFVSNNEPLKSVLLDNRPELSFGSRRPPIAWLIDTYLLRFASADMEYIRESENATSGFDQIYAQFEQYIYEPNTIELVSLSCLRGVTATTSHFEGFGFQDFKNFTSLELGPDVTLRPASAREIDLARADPGAWFGEPAPLFAIGDFGSTPVVIESRQVLSTLIDPFSRTERAKFHDLALDRGQLVVSALQVLQPGPVVIGTVRHQTTNPFLYYFDEAYSDHELDALIRDDLSRRSHGSTSEVKSDSGSDSDQEADVGRPIYWFPPQNISDLSVLVRKIEALSEQGPIRLALRRLRDSWHRRHPEDALIDIWIALEALFSPTDRGELGFRISVRLAAYIGLDATDAAAILDHARKSYDYRSTIAHGRTNKKVMIEREVAKARDYLYRTLYRTLIQGDSIDGKLLEESIFGRFDSSDLDGPEESEVQTAK
ncbi:MAG: HEPN domain-containing protein [Chloroflexota bacterium]|nr:HEPN domain-containing protein [Chloroflexota bacterium]